MGAMYDILALINENKRLKQQIEKLEAELNEMRGMQQRSNTFALHTSGTTLHGTPSRSALQRTDIGD